MDFPCYNSLAEARHDREQSYLHSLEVQAEALQDELLEQFKDGEQCAFLDFDNVMEEVACDVQLFQLIENAWRNGEYRQLGFEIRDTLFEAAEDLLKEQKRDLELLLEEQAAGGDGEIPS